MILKSKLSNKYPIADLKYLSGNKEGLDPVFAGRLSALARDKKVVVFVTSGYRSTAEQEKLYNLCRAGKLRSASKPGLSWHEFRLAVDTSIQPIRGMGNDKLKKYGLCKPISYEGWHIQPIETNGKTNRKQFEPEIVKEEVVMPEITVEEAKKIVKEKAGLSDDTMQYLMFYEYDDELIVKLAKAMM